MRAKLIGCYDLGPQSVKLWLRAGRGGEFDLVPASGRVPRITVGADCGGWFGTVGVLQHEVMEFAMVMGGLRFAPAPDYGQDNGGYTFVMTHTQFSEASARTGMFIAAALPDLATAWNKWRKRK